MIPGFHGTAVQSGFHQFLYPNQQTMPQMCLIIIRYICHVILETKSLHRQRGIHIFRQCLHNGILSLPSVAFPVIRYLYPFQYSTHHLILQYALCFGKIPSF